MVPNFKLCNYEKSYTKVYFGFSEPPRPDGTTPARIVRIDPEGIVEVPERSVGFEFECFVEGNPEPRVTWSRGKCNTYLLQLSKVKILINS